MTFELALAVLRGERTGDIEEASAVVEARGLHAYTVIRSRTTQAGRMPPEVQNEDLDRAARLPQAEHEDLVQRFGREPEGRAPYWDAATKVYPVLKPEEARKIMAGRARRGR